MSQGNEEQKEELKVYFSDLRAITFIAIVLYIIGIFWDLSISYFFFSKDPILFSRLEINKGIVDLFNSRFTFSAFLTIFFNIFPVSLLIFFYHRVVKKKQLGVVWRSGFWLFLFLTLAIAVGHIMGGMLWLVSSPY